MRYRLALPAPAVSSRHCWHQTRGRSWLLAPTLLFLLTSAGLGLEYGGLTFYQSTPDDVKNVHGDFRGCQTDNPDSPTPSAEVTRCTVIQTTGSTPDASLRQEFVFKRGVLQAVRVTASDAQTFEALSAAVAAQYAGIKPPVVLANRKRLSVLIAEPKAARDVGHFAAPRLVHHVEPEYPERLKTAHPEGAVLLEGLITEDGNVEDVRVVQPVDPALDQAAMRAVKQWKYDPATLDGDPIRVSMRFTATFSLHGAPRTLHAVGTTMPTGVFVTCNIPCTVWIDGAMKATLEANNGTLIEASAGKRDLVIKSVKNPSDLQKASVVVGEH